MAQIPYMNWMGDQPTGSAYDVYQYYLGGGGPGGTSAGGGGGGGTGIASLPWYLQTGGGGGGGGGDFKGGGTFGNLDLSKTKTFNKDVWRETGGVGAFDWVPEDVKGYWNPTLGNWQTKAGKNISHLGIPPEKIPGLTGLASNLLGIKSKRKSGDIKGTFSEGWDEGFEDIKGGLKKKIAFGRKKIEEKKKQVQEFMQQKKEEKERKEALATQLAAAQKEIDSRGYQDYGQGAASEETQRSYEDPSGGYTGAGEAADWGGGEKEGGLIRKAQGGRVDYGLGGWLKRKLGLGQKEAFAMQKANSNVDQHPDVMRDKLMNYFKAKVGGKKYVSPQYYETDDEQPSDDVIRDRAMDYFKAKMSGQDYAVPETYRAAEGGMVKDLTKDPEYRGWKKMYEANPGVGSMHEKHKTFIKFYKQHERDKKKFGGLAGLLYG